MVYTVTTAKITQGHGPEAWEWARTLAQLARVKHDVQASSLQCTAEDNHEISLNQGIRIASRASRTAYWMDNCRSSALCWFLSPPRR